MGVKEGGRRLAAALGIPLGLFALALAVRALRWPLVFGGDGLQPYGNDTFYHLRRITYTLANFPASLEFDRYIHFPHGARPIWTPVFDWVLAALVRPFVAADDPEAVERWIVWAPPLIGAATVVLLYRLGRRHLGTAVGLLAAALLALLPGHTWYSQLAFVDHHVAIALTGLLCLSAGMAFLAPGASPVRGALALGTAVACALLVWPGSLLHVAVVEAFCFAALALGRDARDSAARLRGLALANALALALVLPLTWDAAWPQWSTTSPVVLSHFQPWLFGALAVLAGCCALLWQGSRLGRSASARLASGAGAGAIVLVLSVLVLPDLLTGAGDAWRWLAREESFQSGVSESQPLFLDQEGFTFRIAFIRLTPFFLVVPLALVALGREARRRGDAAVGLLVCWAAAVCAVAVVQRRFFNSASIAVALLLAWSAWRVGHGRGARVRAAVAVALALLLGPSLASYGNELTNLRRVLQGEGFEISIRRARHKTAMLMARWLRHNTPPTSGWLDASVQPEYAVLGPWSIGHVIEYVGRRPTVVDNFGDDLGAENFELAQRYFRATESEAAALLERLGARYVIAIAARSQGERPEPASMQVALAARHGSERRPTGTGTGPVHPALERHRLVYESRALDPRKTGAAGLYFAYEFVRGARVSGRAAPGARIDVSLPLRTNRRRDLVYRTSAVADGAGRYALRVPYATQGAPPAVRPASAYVFACGDERAALRVREEAVQRGAELAGPALCLPPTGE